jgi:DNA-binding MarR family transcriptional regulator
MSQQKQVRAGEIAGGGERECDLHLCGGVQLKLDEVQADRATTCQPTARENPTQDQLRDLALGIYDARRLRAKVLNGELFGEPAWDMLLALYCLPERGLIMTITALNYCAEIPQTTGYRWQSVLLREGLIERGSRDMDGRCQIVRLTTKGRSVIDQYLARLFHCGTPDSLAGSAPKPGR